MAKVVSLPDEQLSAVVAQSRARAIARFGEERLSKRYTENEWKRNSFIIRRLKAGRRILDAGAAQGFLAHSLCRTKKYDEVHGIGVENYTSLLRDSRIEYHDMSITALAFPDRHYDTTVCMEVLEYMDD